MLKLFTLIFLGLASMAAQAEPLQKMMPLISLQPATAHHASKMLSLANEGYADFSGDWVGSCHLDMGSPDDKMTEIPLHIENNATWIKISDHEGGIQEHQIGQDASHHKGDEYGFFMSHWTFNWLNHSTLLFNFASLSSYGSPDFPRFVTQASARMTWTLVNDTLKIHGEGQYLENDETAVHHSLTCEFVRQ